MISDRDVVRRTSLLALLLLLPAISAVSLDAADPPAAFESYLGQTQPGFVPQLFAPGIVNTEAIEINGVFSDDGRSFFFSRQIDGVFSLFLSDVTDDGWSVPRRLSVYADGESGLAVDMTVSADGRSLYFLGKNADGDSNGAPDLWMMERQSAELDSEGQWGHARALPAPINSDAGEYYPVLVADGSLYFSSTRPGGFGDSDVYRAQRLPDGSFADPVNLGPEINTEFGEGDTYVAPDESYLIVSSTRPGGLGLGDLYVSFREADGGWTPPRNLGSTINSAETDFCPMVTPDGKFMFFSRRIGGGWDVATDGEVLWVDAGVLAP